LSLSAPNQFQYPWPAPRPNARSGNPEITRQQQLQ